MNLFLTLREIGKVLQNSFWHKDKEDAFKKYVKNPFVTEYSLLLYVKKCEMK